jgi:hypothetical protein
MQDYLLIGVAVTAFMFMTQYDVIIDSIRDKYTKSEFDGFLVFLMVSTILIWPVFVVWESTRLIRKRFR